MPARSDMYRRFAIQAKQQLSRASDSEVRRGFADIADHWAGLTEQSDWLDQRLIARWPNSNRLHHPPRHLSLPCNSNRSSRRSRKAASHALTRA